MVVLNINDLLQNYTHFQHYPNHLILLLTLVKVYQYMVERFYMALMLHKKRFVFYLMSNVQLPSIERFDTQMAVHTTKNCWHDFSNGISKTLV